MSTDWVALLNELPPELRIIHDFGNANAPDSKAGRHRLELAPDGTVDLQWWDGERYGRWAAKVDPSLVRRYAEVLVAGGFPTFPVHPLRPGPSFRVFVVQHGAASQQAILARNPLEWEEPWQELCVVADSLCAQIRGEIPGMYNDIPDAVSDVRVVG